MPKKLNLRPKANNIARRKKQLEFEKRINAGEKINFEPITRPLLLADRFDEKRCSKNSKTRYTRKELVEIATEYAKIFKDPIDIIKKATYSQICSYLTEFKPIVLTKKVTDTVKFEVVGDELKLIIKKSTLKKLQILNANSSKSSKSSKSKKSNSSSEKNIERTHKISKLL